MLDTKSTLILKILQKECKNGSYKILDKNDIISALPTRYRCDTDELDHIISYLERQDYVSVKYDDDSIYCLCILPAINEITTPKKKKKEKKFLLPLIVFVLAFIGAFGGAMIARLIKIP